MILSQRTNRIAILSIFPVTAAFMLGLSTLDVSAAMADVTAQQTVKTRPITAITPVVISTIAGQPAATTTDSAAVRQMQDVFTELANNVEPMVVNIKTIRLINSGPPGPEENPNTPPMPSPLPKSPPKLKAPGPNGPSSPFTPPSRGMATGSGVIVRSDGYILTNDHVINGAVDGMVTVTLSDGREFRGKVYPDYRSDLAIVKIDPGNTPLPVATFADDSSVHPGQWAIAVGSPFDLENTMTVGVVSAVGRHQEIPSDGVTGGRYYPDLVQTDAAINPGNSGGPLFNIDGQVMGINVAIESPVDGSAGIGFAIPAKIAVSVMNDLINNGKVVRGYLGIAPDDLTPALQTEFGAHTGAFVRDVTQTSPAGNAGLEASDIITEFGGQSISGEIDLREAIASTAPKKSVSIVYLRQGKQYTTSAVMGQAPAIPEDTLPQASPNMNARLHLGVTVRDLTARDRQALAVDPSTTGVLVLDVTPDQPAGSAAAETGLPLAGSVIQRIGTRNITSKDDFEQALAQLKDADEVTLVVLYNADNSVHQSALTVHM